MKRKALVVLLGAAALLIALMTIGWWASSPENLRKSSVAVMLLTGTICAIQQVKRFPKASPLLLVASIVSVGVPYLTARMGPMFATVFAVSVVIVWTGIGIARVRTRPASASVVDDRS